MPRYRFRISWLAPGRRKPGQSAPRSLLPGLSGGGSGSGASVLQVAEASCASVRAIGSGMTVGARRAEDLQLGPTRRHWPSSSTWLQRGRPAACGCHDPADIERDAVQSVFSLVALRR